MLYSLPKYTTIRLDLPDFPLHSILSRTLFGEKESPSFGANVEADEIPLVFRNDPYPGGLGEDSVEIHLHEKRYLNLLAELQAQEGAQEIGYVHLLAQDAYRMKELPKGELIVIEKLDYAPSGCRLTVMRKRSFRIESVRRHPENGVIYAKVKYLD